MNMIGREYANYLDILVQSFTQMNKEYQKKSKVNSKDGKLLAKLKKLYIGVFGIPEIGFQIRSIYFEKILLSHIFSNNPKKILDAGSGIGAYAFWLGRKFTNAQVVGVDIDKDKSKFCQAMTKDLGLKNVAFIYQDIRKMHKKNKYDLIVAIDVLEHIENYEKTLENFFHMLYKHGYLYIHVPQPNQKRILNLLKNWHHEDHVHEGIAKSTLEHILKKLGFQIVLSQETFGFLGKLAWELNHLMLSRNFVLAGITFPFLYLVARMDMSSNNNDGLGIALLAKKMSDR